MTFPPSQGCISPSLCQLSGTSRSPKSNVANFSTTSTLLKANWQLLPLSRPICFSLTHRAFGRNLQGCSISYSVTRCVSFDFLPPATNFPFNLPLRRSRWRQSVQLAFDPSGIEMAGYTSIKRPANAALVVLLAAVLYPATLHRYVFNVFTLIQ
jgi:hypothetical protein